MAQSLILSHSALSHTGRAAGSGLTAPPNNPQQPIETPMKATDNPTAIARKAMMSFWSAEIKYPAGRDAVRSWKIAGPFRRQIKALKKKAAREARRAA